MVICNIANQPRGFCGGWISLVGRSRYAADKRSTSRGWGSSLLSDGSLWLWCWIGHKWGWFPSLPSITGYTRVAFSL